MNLQNKKKLSYMHMGSYKQLLWTTIGDRLKYAAEKFPKNDALVAVWKKERYSYEHFYKICRRAAKGLIEMGVKKGDCVGIWATNYTEWVITQFSTAMIGAVLVTINPALRENELEYILRDSECQTLILIEKFKSSKYLDMFYNIFPEAKTQMPGKLYSYKFPNLKNVIVLSKEGRPGMYTANDVLIHGKQVSNDKLEKIQDNLDPDDVINIQYTSGTTGFPKGVCLTHHNIINNAYLVGENLNFTNKDRLCIPVPFYHCFGMVLSNMLCVNYGATMVIPNEFFDPFLTLKAVEDEKCTAMHGVPTMFISQLEHPKFDKVNLSSLRTGIMAGAPCPIELMKKVRNKMGIKDITICYGLTEASPVTNQTRFDDAVEIRVETVGKPLQHTEIKIISPDTGKVVPIGDQGEICVRGFQIMKGYHKKPIETKIAVDENGWLHTGDIGTLDQNGYCKITGRLKNMIIRGGENIYPREIEEYLHTHPDVIDVNVFGVPDEKYGEEIAAWIKIREKSKIKEEDIKNYCKGKISYQKIPKYIKFVDEFPMTATGKIQKFRMKEIYMQELGL
ncbi:MAG: AMP-binding protein [Candidatus Thermoplasmatota archaeon]|nr:AMP-binding protein [Candidatus Thermoplasmatota archaeon]